MRRVFHWCQNFGKVVEGFQECNCRGVIYQGNHPSFGMMAPTYDQGLGEVITSVRQREKLMKKQKVVDSRDFPSKNPIVLEAQDKWRWRNRHGLT